MNTHTSSNCLPADSLGFSRNTNINLLIMMDLYPPDNYTFLYLFLCYFLVKDF